MEAQQCVKLTGTNRSSGLIHSSFACSDQTPERSSGPRSTCLDKTRNQPSALHSSPSSCVAMTWWLWRGANTRSHPELGRENPQRQWYCVLRRGRVGRRQVFTTQDNKPPAKKRIPIQSTEIRGQNTTAVAPKALLLFCPPFSVLRPAITRGGAAPREAEKTKTNRAANQHQPGPNQITRGGAAR